MKVYYDIFCNDELLSDGYKLETKFNGVLGEVKSRMVAKGGDNIDIGRGNEFGGGGDDEAVDDQVEKVIDLVDSFHLGETSFTKSDYTTAIKAYMKRIKAHLEEKNPDRVKEFMDGAKEAVKWIVSNFGEFQFFLGEKFDMEAQVVLAYYKDPENDTAPTFVYFMDGLIAKTF